MFKKLNIWFIKTFSGNRILLSKILIELENIHYHLDRLDAFYMMVNKIKVRQDKEIKKK